jgi:hypothetical protein
METGNLRLVALSSYSLVATGSLRVVRWGSTKSYIPSPKFQQIKNSQFEGVMVEAAECLSPRAVCGDTKDLYWGRNCRVDSHRCDLRSITSLRDDFHDPTGQSYFYLHRIEIITCVPVQVQWGAIILYAMRSPCPNSLTEYSAKKSKSCIRARILVWTGSHRKYKPMYGWMPS